MRCGHIDVGYDPIEVGIQIGKEEDAEKTLSVDSERIPMQMTESEQTLSVSIGGGSSVGMSIDTAIVAGGGTPYTGEYRVTPTRETQTLATGGKTMARNIVVEPIPQNYGLITWDGSSLTVS